MHYLTEASYQLWPLTPASLYCAVLTSLAFCLATQHLFRRLEQRLSQEDLLHTSHPLTPVPMFIKHCLGEFRIPQQGCLACKSTAHIQRVLAPGSSEGKITGPGSQEGGKRGLRRGSGTQSPRLSGVWWPAAASLHKTWAWGCRGMRWGWLLGATSKLENVPWWGAELRGTRAFLSHVPKKCILHRAEGRPSDSSAKALCMSL